jgi:hypothetical protein
MGERRRRIQFVFAMAVEFARCGIKPREAVGWARDTYRAYLAEIAAPFGHPDYDWSPESGAQVAHWMEIDYWEQQS